MGISETLPGFPIKTHQDPGQLLYPTELPEVLNNRCYCWKKKPHWWHLVFSQITVEQTSLTGTQECSPPMGGPVRRAVVGKAAVYAQGSSFSTATSVQNSFWNHFATIMSAGKETKPQGIHWQSTKRTDYRLCHIPRNLVTISSGGCLCKEVYLPEKQITALDTVICNFQADYVCCKPVTASDKNHWDAKS